MNDFTAMPMRSIRQQVANYIRQQIQSGKMEAGRKLPSSQQLSKTWGVAESSINAAMATLVKEGLLHRTRKRGTFVARRSQALTEVGIYLVYDVWHDPAAAFRRTLVSEIGQQLRAQGVLLDVWVDPRPVEQHATPWPELVRAAEQRQIQAVILPNPSGSECPWVAQLPIPAVEIGNSALMRNCVCLDASYGAKLAAEELSRLGCRSAGMISVANPQSVDQCTDSSTSIKLFRRQSQMSGMTVCDDWFVHPAEFGSGEEVPEGQSERFGYEAMKRFLAMPDRPDGVYIYHDLVARGALTAVLENRIAVPDELKLVLYRNKEIYWLCPVNAAFVEISVAQTATAMIEMLKARLSGEEASGVIVKPHLIAAQND